MHQQTSTWYSLQCHFSWQKDLKTAYKSITSRMNKCIASIPIMAYYTVVKMKELDMQQPK